VKCVLNREWVPSCQIDYEKLTATLNGNERGKYEAYRTPLTDYCNGLLTTLEFLVAI
jgi:hypothetical protein